MPVRRKFYGRVQSRRCRVAAEARECADDIRIARAGAAALLPPHRDRRCEIRYQDRPVDEQERSAIDTNVSRITKCRKQRTNESSAVFKRILLRDEHILLTTVPPPRPVLVGPADAKGKIGLPRVEDGVERMLEQTLSVEPIMVITEAVNAMFARQRGLPSPNRRVS